MTRHRSLIGAALAALALLSTLAINPAPAYAGVVEYGNPLVPRSYATDFPMSFPGMGPILVVLRQPLPDGVLQAFKTWNQGLGVATPYSSSGNQFHAYVLRPTGVPDEYTVIFDSGLLTVPFLPQGVDGQVETFPLLDPGIPVQAGDVLAFYGQGIPVDAGLGTDVLCFPATAATNLADSVPPYENATLLLNSAGFPILATDRTYSFAADVSVTGVQELGNPLVERTYATDTSPEVLVIIQQPLPDGTLRSFKAWNSARGSEGNQFNAYVLRPTGAQEYAVVFDSGPLTVPALSNTNGQVETYPTQWFPVQSGDLIAFYGQGIPLDIGPGDDVVFYPAPLAPILGTTIAAFDANYPLFGADRMYSFSAEVDLDAPQAPSGLLASLTGSQVNLTWSISSVNELGFVIERALVTNNVTGTFASVSQVGAGQSSGFDQPPGGGTYAYRVYAFNGAGISSPSNEVRITTTTRPAAPGNLVATLRSGPRVLITFTDNASNEAGFVIERNDSGGAFTQIATIGPVTGGAGTAPEDTTVVPGRTYSYRAYAFNDGGASEFSNISTVGPPEAPTDLVVTHVPGMSGVTVIFTDNSSSETGFQLQRSVNGGAFLLRTTVAAQAGTGSRVTRIDPVTSGQTYSYRVRAVNALGPSNFSNTREIRIGTPSAPTELSASVGTAPLQVSLRFRDNANNEEGFVVQRRVNGGAFADLRTFPARVGTGIVSATDADIVPGDRYGYRVRAVNENGPSAYSGITNVTIPSPPAAPSDFRGTSTPSGTTTARVDLRWQDNSNNETRFVIQRATNPTFTAGVTTTFIAADEESTTQTASRNATLYYRIRASNAYGQSAWVNLNPFGLLTF